MARLIDALRIATGLFALGLPVAAVAITAIDGASESSAANAAPKTTAPAVAAAAASDPAIWVLVIAGVAIVAMNVRRRRRGSIVIS